VAIPLCLIGAEDTDFFSVDPGSSKRNHEVLRIRFCQRCAEAFADLFMNIRKDIFIASMAVARGRKCFGTAVYSGKGAKTLPSLLTQ
jgi:hypothetical protein